MAEYPDYEKKDWSWLDEKMKDEYIKALEDYIEFLHVHGQGPSKEVIEQGERHRDLIAELKSKIQ